MARTWWTGARSGGNGGNCVEVANGRPAVVICDSKDHRRGRRAELRFGLPGRSAFIVGSRSWTVADRSPDRLCRSAQACPRSGTPPSRSRLGGPALGGPGRRWRSRTGGRATHTGPGPRPADRRSGPGRPDRRPRVDRSWTPLSREALARRLRADGRHLSAATASALVRLLRADATTPRPAQTGPVRPGLRVTGPRSAIPVRLRPVCEAARALLSASPLSDRI
ncbi:DUF397 domain-containing protein [Micromonospora sp. DR5-3]|uniref:DUF397 domain-containing protein n=1 Tax=unclassified Micromonospora TaxID=2617518 RepID=UPI0021080E4E|nr:MULTISPECIES: DUF397 domain-containing protein [unclassified Micromonospora]MCW3817636.1 DUF397 domain-containing protein [Micromonospora sp. DR5-3]